MSEGHAIYFASAEPGHESSDTDNADGGRQGSSATFDSNPGLPRGEHASQDPGNPNVTQQTADGDTNVISMGTPENGQRQPSPERNESNTGDLRNDDSPFEQESINLMDDVVESFRRKETTKLKALSTIIGILDSNTTKPEKTKDAAVESYSRTLNEVEALAASAIRRGQQVQQGLQPPGTPNTQTAHARDQRRDAEIDELISHISGESRKSKRPLSGDFFDADDHAHDSDADVEQSNRKRRVFESQMPWFSREEEER